ncbi:MAG: MAPEG family protein [Alphaproteobacteria bacterium]
MGYEYTALVTILAIIVTLFFMFRTGLNRGKYKIKAPKMSGNETWERICRVHGNTVEQMVIFLPALWLAALTGGDKLAAAVGLVWPIARLFYSKLYLSNPKGRGPGILLTILPTAALAGIAAFHVIKGIVT